MSPGLPYCEYCRKEPGQQLDDSPLFDKWEVAFEAVINGHVNVDLIWPEDTMPHWLPEKWRDVTDPFDQHKLIRDNPKLATLAGRINAAALHLPDRNARMFMDEHVACGTQWLHCSCDAEIDTGLGQVSWPLIRPCSENRVDETTLPDVGPVVHLIQAVCKVPDLKGKKVPLASILTKALPQSSGSHNMHKTLTKHLENEAAYRAVTQMLVCYLLGTYRHMDTGPYNFELQVRLLATFTFATRAETVAFLTNPDHTSLVRDACAAFLTYVTTLMPHFEKVLAGCYDWSGFSKDVENVLCTARQFMKTRFETFIGISNNSWWAELSELIHETSTMRVTKFTVTRSTPTGTRPNIASAANLIARKGFSGKPPTRDLSALSTPNPEKYDIAMRLILTLPRGFSSKALDALPFTRRGRLVIDNIMGSLARGTTSREKMYERLGPGDLTWLLAYIWALRDSLDIAIYPQPLYVRHEQVKTILKQSGAAPWTPLPDDRINTPFCVRCERFKEPVPVCKQSDNSYSINSFTGTVHCFNKKHKECLHLSSLPLLGNIVVLKHTAFTKCCYCDRVCVYTLANIQDSLPWCGSCERPLPHYTGYSTSPSSSISFSCTWPSDDDDDDDDAN